VEAIGSYSIHSRKARLRSQASRPTTFTRRRSLASSDRQSWSY